MSRRRVIFLFLALTPILSGCVTVDELASLTNGDWLGSWALSVGAEFFVSIAGRFIGFIALAVGLAAIWGLYKWATGGDSLPFGMFIMLFMVERRRLIL